MTLQRRLALVPGCDMLSPKEAQRILANHQFPDDPKTQSHHQEHGYAPRWPPSPKKPRNSRLQTPRQNHHDLYSSNRSIRHDEQQTLTTKRQRSKLDIPSKNPFCVIPQRRKGRDWARQKTDSDNHAPKKQQQMNGAYSTTRPGDILPVSKTKQHPTQEDSISPLEPRNTFSEASKTPTLLPKLFFFP